jgi:predicted signal transduction protein with EAL and GGDEF domain
MTTVAEGVESLDHVNTAVVTGCDEMQGFFFSKPVPADRVEEVLANDRSNEGRTRTRAPQEGLDQAAIKIVAN